jgi:hypothetical protein
MPQASLYDVRVRSPRTGKALGKWSTVADGTSSTSKALKFNAGGTYCVAVRAEHKVGRGGEWSGEHCLSRPR